MTLFAESLKSHRQRLRLKQADMAKLLDVSERSYWGWESGRSQPYPIAQEGALARLSKLKDGVYPWGRGISAKRVK